MTTRDGAARSSEGAGAVAGCYARASGSKRALIRLRSDSTAARRFQIERARDERARPDVGLGEPVVDRGGGLLDDDEGPADDVLEALRALVRSYPSSTLEYTWRKPRCECHEAHFGSIGTLVVLNTGVAGTHLDAHNAVRGAPKVAG